MYQGNMSCKDTEKSNNIGCKGWFMTDSLDLCGGTCAQQTVKRNGSCSLCWVYKNQKQRRQCSTGLARVVDNQISKQKQSPYTGVSLFHQMVSELYHDHDLYFSADKSTKPFNQMNLIANQLGFDRRNSQIRSDDHSSLGNTLQTVNQQHRYM